MFATSCAIHCTPALSDEHITSMLTVLESACSLRAALLEVRGSGADSESFCWRDCSSCLRFKFLSWRDLNLLKGLFDQPQCYTIDPIGEYMHWMTVKCIWMTSPREILLSSKLHHSCDLSQIMHQNMLLPIQTCP